jgi:HlyD family secretion protein
MPIQSKIRTFVRGHSGLATLILILVVLFAVIGGRAATRKAVESSTTNTKPVALVEARTFRDDLTTVSVDGVVESASQADIKSQVSAPISHIYVSVGDYVSAGQTIMEFQNADIRAQLEQARANLALARGQYVTGDVSTEASRKSAVDLLRTSYTRVEEGMNAQIGQFLYNGNPNSKQLQTLVTDSTINNQLILDLGKAQDALKSWKASINSLTDISSKEQLTLAIGEAQRDLAIINKFLDTVSAALVNAAKGATPSDVATINTWQSVLGGVRATVSSAISSLTSSGSGISANQAQTTAAEAGVRALEAQLAKTIISAPISGTIAALPLRVSEFASMGQLITTVVGASGTLEIKAFASSEDINRIAKGAPVTIQGNIPGVVVSVAPSVNQANKKVEVNIDVPGAERSRLVVGQSVQAKILATKEKTSTTKPAMYVLPIQNVKIIPGAAYVYTVDENSKIVKHEVTLGEVKGDFVEIKTGLTDDMKIVSPVYELEEGEIVKTE